MSKDEAIQAIIAVAHARLSEEERSHFLHLGLAQPETLANLMNLYLRGEPLTEDELVSRLRDVIRGLRKIGVA